MRASELRQSILQTAVQGRLVPQVPHDEPASELLKRIQREKIRLIRDGQIKKEKPLPPVNEDEMPYDLPNGWVWCRLYEISSVITDGDHQPPPKEDSGVPFLVISNISKGYFDFTNTRFVSDNYYSSLSAEKKAIKNDILFTVTGSFGIPVVVDDNREFCFQRHIALIRAMPLYDLKYLYTFLLSPFCYAQCVAVAPGTAQKTVPLSGLRNLVIPIPPLAEQHRIVAKVDELMALCDVLEIAEKDLEALEDHLAEYLPKSILQAAVQGKLVPQNLHDEPASEVLKRIQKEKARLVKEGKVKQGKPLPPITDDDVPNDLPEGWVWCRLGEIANNHDSQRKPVSVEHRQHQAKVYDYYGATGVIDKVENYLFEGVYLLIGEDGGNFFVNRNVAFIVAGKFWANNHVHVLSFSKNIIKYVCHYLNSIDLPSMGLINGIAVPKLNQSNLNSIIIPLPPLAEQHRIVAKVDELISLCEDLKNTRTLAAEHDIAKIIPFPQPYANEDIEIGIAARSDGTQPISDKLRQAIEDWDEEDE